MTSSSAKLSVFCLIFFIIDAENTKKKKRKRNFLVGFWVKLTSAEVRGPKVNIHEVIVGLGSN